MKIALLGYTGFVGSNLLEQLKTEYNNIDLYNSKNFKDIINKEYDKIYCCCVKGIKYIANKNPIEDLKEICDILLTLKTVKCDEFYLVSSQDCNSSLSSNSVFTTLPPTEYGKNRLYFENQIMNIFKNVYILRIGCLFGKNLKKNVIFDLLNHHYLENLKEDFTMQLYDLKNLLKDFNLLKSSNFINIPINRFSQPVWISEIIDMFNQFNFNYDFKLVKNYKKCYENGGLLYSKEVQLENLKEFIYERLE